MIKLNHIYCENCIRTMNRMPDDFIDLVVTSPPYDNLRNYSGHKFTYTEFQNIVIGLHRVLKEGAVIVWVIGDETKDGNESDSSFRQALFFQEIGFKKHDTMIYLKEGSFPESVRYKQAFEYMFVFVKGKLKTFNPIKDYRNLQNKIGITTKRQRDGSTKRHFINNTNKYSMRSNVWKFQCGYQKSSKDEIAYLHPATFPEALAHDHIISWSNPGDVIYDCFSGSGTVAKMALLTGRKYVGSEIVEKYVRQSNLRLSIIKEK